MNINYGLRREHLMDMRCRQSEEYRSVEVFYNNRRAVRSGVEYMEHIDEGLRALSTIDLDLDVLKAWCLHPIVQSDEHYINSVISHIAFSRPWKLAFDYRAVANAYLPKHSSRIPTPSLIPSVNIMLTVDKIHNRWQFERTCRERPGVYPNEMRLRVYFAEWLAALDVEPELILKFENIWNNL